MITLKRNFFIIAVKFLLIILLISTLVSCNYLEEKSLPLVTTPELSSHRKIERVAILNFVNLTDVPEIEPVLRMHFLSQLSTKGYTLIKLGEIDNLLEMAEINISNVDMVDPYKLGKILKADALIYGTITKCSKLFAGIYSNVSVGASIKMVETATSKTLWAAEHTERTHGGGVPSISPFSIPGQIVDSALNYRDKVLHETAGTLVKKFMESMNDNPFKAAPETKIISIKHINDERVVSYFAQPGDTLYRIADKFYGNGSKWPEIKQVNAELQESALEIGQEVIIPDIPVLDNLQNAPMYKEKKIAKIIYKVKWGDSLYKMADTLYGTGKKWEIIFENNRDSIVSATDVPVGQILILPLEAN